MTNSDQSTGDARPPDEESKAKPDPIDLEPEPEPAEPRTPSPPPEQTKPACPECGAPMEPGEELCIRCGLDDDTPAEKPAKETREATPAAAPGEARPLAARSRSEMLDVWLPVGLGAVSLVVLISALLAGVVGLYPHLRLEEEVIAPGWAERFTAVLRNIVLLVFWAGCGLAGLFALGAMLERPLGDARLAAVRMGAIVVTIRLAAILTVPGPLWIEWMAESILQGVGFILLAMAFFRLALRDAAVLAAWTLMAILTLWLFTYAVQWALGT